MSRQNQDFEELDRQLSLSNNCTHYTFNLFVEDPKFNRIHPIKQKQLYDLITQLIKADGKKQIEEIIVFGSCLSLYCNSYSDIDLMVLGAFEEYHPKIDLHPYGQVDLFGYNRAYFMEQKDSNKFFKKVWERGYKIYE